MVITEINKGTASQDVCLNFSLNIITDTDIDTVVIAPNTSSQQTINAAGFPNRQNITFNTPRNRNIVEVIVTGGGESVTEFIEFIPKWTIQLPTIAIASNATATVTGNLSIFGDPFLNTIQRLNLQYSIDDITFQQSNSYTSLNEGNYIFYINDGFGCNQQINFIIGEFFSVPPYFFVSMLNPIYFAQRNTLRKNPLNQLSYEFVDDTNFKDFKYILNSNDVYQFQFRSSYQNNKAILVDCNGNTNELQIVKKSNNIQREDIRDCVIFPPNENIEGVQLRFEGGNIYDNELNIIGQSTLDGTLLVANKIGNFIEIINEGLFEILDIIEDENGFTLVLNWNETFVGSSAEIAKTVFNANDYEIYEFILPVGLNPNKYQLALFGSNETIDISESIALRYLSEQFEMTTENLDNYHRLTWKNDENNQITWETGIECTTYLPKNENPTFSPESEDEVFMTDIAPRLLEANVNEIYTFYLGLVPLAVARQIQYIVSNDYLLIDGVFYTKQETPEVEPANGSNNYIVQVPLMLADTFNTNERKGISDIDTNTAGYVELDDNGYLNL